jgi:hypothetical protein
MSPPVSTMQLKLDFDAAITAQFRTLKQCVAATVYGFRGGLGAVAAACDVSPSTLSRMLNENEDDPRHFPLDYLPVVIKCTGDLRPIHWLVATFVPDPETRKETAIAALCALLPQLNDLVKQAGARK